MKNRRSYWFGRTRRSALGTRVSGLTVSLDIKFYFCAMVITSLVCFFFFISFLSSSIDPPQFRDNEPLLFLFMADIDFIPFK